MERTSIRALVDSVLNQMKVDGMKEGTILSYRTAFNAIIRYFEQAHEYEFSNELVDECILSIRAECESGKLKKPVWRKIRRCGELLKTYYEHGTLELARCRQWEALHNPLRRAPTESELADNDNIWGLVARTKQEIEKYNYSESAGGFRFYEANFKRILQAHIDWGIVTYSPKLLHEMMLAMRKEYEHGKISLIVFQMFRKTISLLEEKHKLGTLNYRCLSPYGKRELTDTFSRLLDSFEAGIKLLRPVKESTVKQYKFHSRGFLWALEDDGIFSFDEMTPSLLNMQITKFAKKYKGGLRTNLNAVRAFFEYLYNNGDTATDLSLAIPKFFSPHRKIYEGFACDEIEELLSAPDKSTKLGKRNYAIIMLAFHTGIRACDIANLRRQDICWHTNEIRIVQSKTEIALTIPLQIECGNAIADYLLHARPESDEPYVFLRTKAPHRRLRNRSVSSLVTKCVNKTGIENNPTKRLGIHSFRRSFGKRLLESEVSFELIREILGQTRQDSLNPYIAIDESNLLNCALGLFSIEKAGECQ